MRLVLASLVLTATACESGEADAGEDSSVRWLLAAAVAAAVGGVILFWLVTT